MHIQVVHRGPATGRTVRRGRSTCLLLLNIISELSYVNIYIHTHCMHIYVYAYTHIYTDMYTYIMRPDARSVGVGARAPNSCTQYLR